MKFKKNGLNILILSVAFYATLACTLASAPASAKDPAPKQKQDFQAGGKATDYLNDTQFRGLDQNTPPKTQVTGECANPKTQARGCSANMQTSTGPATLSIGAGN